MLLRQLASAFSSSSKVLKTVTTVVRTVNKSGSIIWTRNNVSRRTSNVRFYSAKANMIVDFDEIKKATSNNKIVIIDVREPDELKEHGTIPNSINIPLGSVADVLGTVSETEFEKIYGRKKPSEDTEIIFYCMIGKRSGKAQQNAFTLGYKNVKNYLGSWNDWASKV